MVARPLYDGWCENGQCSFQRVHNPSVMAIRSASTPTDECKTGERLTVATRGTLPVTAMARSVKFFWLDANDCVQPVAHRRHEQIFDRRVAAPEFAGQVLRLITAIVDTEQRRVAHVEDVNGSLVGFDMSGRADHSTALGAAIEALSWSSGDNRRAVAAAIRYRYEYTFDVTEAQRAAIERYLGSSSQS